MAIERPEQTSADIRRVALEMFATDGYDATSVRDIAASVGIRGSTMYHHFASKEEILWDLTQSALDLLAATWLREQKGAIGPESRLRAFVRASVYFHGKNQTAARLVNSQLHRLAPAHYARAVELRHAYEEELTDIVRACLESGRYAVPDTRITVFAILQMTTAIATWFDPAGELVLPQVADVYEELALKMLAPVQGGNYQDRI